MNIWTGSALLIILALFFQLAAYKERQIKKVRAQLITLDNAIAEKKEEQALLEEKEKSWSDPAWVELVLMEKLGVVPEGQQKVCFISRH